MQRRPLPCNRSQIFRSGRTVRVGVFHSFIIDDTLLGSGDTGEGKFITFQIDQKSLLPKASTPLSVRLLDCPCVQKKEMEEEQTFFLLLCLKDCGETV